MLPLAPWVMDTAFENVTPWSVDLENWMKLLGLSAVYLAQATYTLPSFEPPL